MEYFLNGAKKEDNETKSITYINLGVLYEYIEGFEQGYELPTKAEKYYLMAISID